MRRRGFLGAILALPFVRPIARVAAAVKARLFPVVYVGAGLTGPDSAVTLASALSKVSPGGTIFLLPGHSETINEPMDIGSTSLVGLTPIDRPVLTVVHQSRDMTFWATGDPDTQSERPRSRK